MEHFVARQPILNSAQDIFAYELLFRSSLENFFKETDGEMATSRVIADSFMLFGLEKLTDGRKAFINFTRHLLVQDYGLVLPKEHTVVEILENVEPDEEVLASCRKLKNHGYTLALDDFIFHPRFHRLLDLADIVKVDFLQSGPDERQELAQFLLPRGIKLLAEKVETLEEFESAKDMGYSYFQGYFFQKPVIVARKDVPGFKLNLLRLLQEANRPEPDFERLADLIQKEVSVAYRLFRLVNSAAFGLRESVDSLVRALGILGEDGVRKWLSLMAMSGAAQDKPSELVVSCLIRAKFCETLAVAMGHQKRSQDLFLVGLFSHLDALIGRPLEELLQELALKADVADGVRGKGRLRGFLWLIQALEEADWPRVSKLGQALGARDNQVVEAYLEAIEWPQTILFEK